MLYALNNISLKFGTWLARLEMFNDLTCGWVFRFRIMVWSMNKVAFFLFAQPKISWNSYHIFVAEVGCRVRDFSYFTIIRRQVDTINIDLDILWRKTKVQETKQLRTVSMMDAVCSLATLFSSSTTITTNKQKITQQQQNSRITRPVDLLPKYSSSVISLVF